MSENLTRVFPVPDGESAKAAEWAYTRELAAELFPDDQHLQTYGTLAGMAIANDSRRYDIIRGREVVPENVASDQIEDWYTGRIVRGALDKNRELDETCGPISPVTQEPLF